MGRGRPKEAGERGRDGRLVTPKRVPANDVVIARHEWYGNRFGNRVAGDTYDPIGRAWASGLLENERHDPAILRDAGRRYAALYAMVYNRTQCAVADNERTSRGTGEGQDSDPIGERYNIMDRLARDAGGKERLAMHKLVLHPNSDENPVWLDRLIQDRYWKRVTPIDSRDRMILVQAVRALVAMVEG